jgi:7,8-dihydroneopterin aldolase/epimerase/oxygenase
MTLVIELEGLELHGYHGVLPEERRDGQRFLVDVAVEPLEATAGATDRLADAVDYRQVVAVVQQVFDAERYGLLEALTDSIADELLRVLPLRWVRVRVRKPEVRLALPVGHSAVVVERVSEPER